MSAVTNGPKMRTILCLPKETRNTVVQAATNVLKEENIPPAKTQLPTNITIQAIQPSKPTVLPPPISLQLLKRPNKEKKSETIQNHPIKPLQVLQLPELLPAPASPFDFERRPFQSPSPQVKPGDEPDAIILPSTPVSVLEFTSDLPSLDAKEIENCYQIALEKTRLYCDRVQSLIYIDISTLKQTDICSQIGQLSIENCVKGQIFHEIFNDVFEAIDPSLLRSAQNLISDIKKWNINRLNTADRLCEHYCQRILGDVQKLGKLINPEKYVLNLLESKKPVLIKRFFQAEAEKLENSYLPAYSQQLRGSENPTFLEFITSLNKQKKTL